MTKKPHKGPVFQSIPVTGNRASSFLKVCVCVHVEGHTKDEYVLLHLNKVLSHYESNIVTYDTSNDRAYWRHEDNFLSARNGFAIGFLGWSTEQMQGAGYVMAELTIGVGNIRNRLATGTSYTNTDTLDFTQHKRRYLSQIGGEGPVMTVPVTEINLSTVHGTSFELISGSAVGL